MVSRRRFLKDGARFLFLGFMFIGLRRLFRFGQLTRRTDQSCIRPPGKSGVCRGCTVVSSCSLPQALSFRRNSA